MDPFASWRSFWRFLVGIGQEDAARPAEAASLPLPPRSDDAWPDPEARVDGALRRVDHLGDVERARVARLLPAGETVDHGYSLYTIALWSAGEETRAVVAVPLRVDAPPGGWHVIANNHGTTGLGRPCSIIGTDAGSGLAGLFGARGVIGVAPEYPGLGSAGIHHYLVAESESRAVLDALRATRALARWKGWPLSGRMALAGMSQGGHATLAAAAIHRAYAPDLDVRAFAVAAPSTGWEEHWRAGTFRDGPHLVYHAMLVYAWAHHYGYDGPPLWAPGVVYSIDRDMRNSCAWSPRGAATLEEVLPRRADEIFSADFLGAFRSGWWGKYRAFRGWFARNRIGPYRQTAPLRIYQGTADTAVPERATRQLVAALRAGGVTVDYQVVPGAGHLDTAFGFLSTPARRTAEATGWLRSHLERE